MDNRRKSEAQVHDRPSPDDVRWDAAEVIDLDPERPSAGGLQPSTLVAGVLVVLVALVGLTGFPPGSQVTPSSTDATVGPRASLRLLAEPTQSVATPGSWAWSAMSLRGYGRGATVENLWVLGDRFVAEIETNEGPDGGPYGPVSSVLLTSTDGLAWSDDGVDLPTDGFVVEAGTVAAGRLWVLGYTGPVETAQWQLWSTDDGSWRHEADPVGLGDGPSRVTELAYRSECEPNGDCRAIGWVAVVATPSSTVDRLRISDDGQAWEDVEVGEVRGRRSIVGIAYARGAWIVAAVDRPPARTVVFISRDRSNWGTPVVPVLEGEGRDVASGVAGLALVGTEQPGNRPRPRVWLSFDGASWLQLRAGIAYGRTPTPMDHVTETDHGYIALSATTGDAWVSTDGEHWWNFPAFAVGPSDTVRALTAFGDILLAAGRSTAGLPTFWAGSLTLALDRP